MNQERPLNPKTKLIRDQEKSMERQSLSPKEKKFVDFDDKLISMNTIKKISEGNLKGKKIEGGGGGGGGGGVGGGGVGGVGGGGVGSNNFFARIPTFERSPDGW